MSMGEGKVTRVRFEHLREAFGVGTARPRLSWNVETQASGWMQAAYEVELYGPDGRLSGATGRVESQESVLVPWPFAALASRERAAVRVRAWGTDGRPLAWSELAPLEAGLLDASDWSARFISPDLPAQGHASRPAPLLRTDFHVRAGLIRARLYITAHGVYEAEINGRPANDHVMPPGWTSYSHRLRYQVCDVTALLREGGNAIGAMLGNGWFRGRLGWSGGRSNVYGDRLALLAQLEITYADGSVQRVVTDSSWRASEGPVLEDDIYDGETYDARLEKPGWSSPGFDDTGWAGVQVLEAGLETLFAPMGPPVRRVQFIEPVSIFQSPSGKTLIDFGQNLVGRLRIRVKGEAGQTVTLRHAEVLEGGELATRPLRLAKATDRYTLKGGGVETWEPRFTFHGFRYAEVEGWPGELQKEDLLAAVCHSDMERTGWFECSDALLNRLHENAVWSMRGNFFDIPTDCPQRDERLGWTGDIQVFSPTASFLYDSAGFLASWLRDLAAEQKEKGFVPYVVPDVLPGPQMPGAAWGDAASLIPWVLYQRFGDRQILADQFESMQAWVDLVDSIAGERHLWDTGPQFGDWLDPAAPPDNPGAARTPGFIVATAYFARSAEVVGLAAGVIGKKDEEARYLALAGKVREAFNREYVTPAGRLVSDASTAYALALQFALLPEETQRRRAGQRLAELARASPYRISTGFVGTPLICDALCGAGQEETAFRLLMTRECPSWLYPVTMGATTIWERWDSMLPDGSVNPGEMTSFNHYALGAVADWMHRTIGGLAPAAPGYRKLAFRPRPGGGLTGAQARHITPYGAAVCRWRVEAGRISVEVEVPPNTTASVSLPGKPDGEMFEVGSGRHRWEYAYPGYPKPRPILTPESSVGELIDDAEALQRVIAVLSPHGAGPADRFFWQEGVSIRAAAASLPEGERILSEIEKALASLSAGR